MDFIPDKEFHRIFDRVSKIVDLKGAGTPQEINERLNRKIKEGRYLPRRSQLGLFLARSRIPNLKRLIFAGFGRRTIDEGVARPQGIVALTLKYGREKAKDILLARARWAVFQMKEGQLTLRISEKNNRDKPKILLKVGKTDKLIKDYLEVYEAFRKY